jgi:hypothetical protein
LIPGGKNRLCACGCESPLADLRADAVWATDACRKRGYAPVSTEKARNRKGSSGFQMSYPKAVRIATARLAMFVEAPRVEAALKEALPERQRERLEARP